MLNGLLADKATWYPFLFDTALNAARSAAIWLTLALVIAFVAGVFITKNSRKFLKISLIAAIVYSCAVAVTLFSLKFAEDKAGGEFVARLFVPLTVLIVAIAASGVMLVVKRTRLTCVLAGILVGASLIVTLVFMGIHFASGDGADMNWITNDDVNSVGLYVSAVLLTAAVIVAAFLLDRGNKGFDTKSIAYAAVCIAMSFALSYLRVVKMPQGGSITIASLLPLMIYSYMFGTKKGVFAGMIYGLLQAVQDPYIIHPAQFFLDYPIAFACIGLAGAFARVKALDNIPQLQFALGAVVAGLARFLMHYLSGVFAFGAFAGEQSPYLYSFVYQAGYVLPDIAIVIVVGVLVFSSKSFVRMMRKYNAKAAENEQQTEN